jgi:hypothetical protein
MTDDRDAQRAARRAETEAMVEAEAAKAKEVLTKRAEQKAAMPMQMTFAKRRTACALGRLPIRLCKTGGGAVGRSGSATSARADRDSCRAVE